jgi:Zn-dependent peptidase ImmA (M78 family)/DNA-binding XRE family transcriptional regulator
MKDIITPGQLGERLRLARHSTGLSQMDVASALGVARPTISQVESGKRGVSGLELVRLARLYGRPVEWFVESDGATGADDTAALLFRGAELRPEDRAVVLEFQSLCRSYGELERLLNRQVSADIPEYGAGETPATGREAIREGEKVATDERRRLGIGDAPIRNAIDLLEIQDVRVFALPLHDGRITGIFLYESDLGPCILINRTEHRNKVPFNAAHEYAHLLFDRQLRARVSAADEALQASNGGGDLLESRANSFAAAFLLPADGIEKYLGERGMHRRDRRGLGLTDIIYLQHAFGVSYQAVLFRLQNLGWLDRDRREALGAVPDESLARSLGLFDNAPIDSQEEVPCGSSRYRYLALEAYREGKISLGKLAELLDMGVEAARDLVWGLEVEQPATAGSPAI